LLGKFDGILKSYYKNGDLHYQESYSHGELNGTYLEYDKNGKLLIEGEYLFGKKQGDWFDYTSEAIIFIDRYSLGTLEYRRKNYKKIN
jgi:antitoxin component YwqK of YwqJK toxin-antitoxin module